MSSFPHPPSIRLFCSAKTSRPAGGLVPRGMRITLKDGSEINLGEELVDIVLRAGAGDTTVRLGGRAQAVRCLLACVASPEIEVKAFRVRSGFRVVYGLGQWVEVYTSRRAQGSRAYIRCKKSAASRVCPAWVT